MVLDLFAGTGALGLEALSRGAAWVTFVDDGRVAGKLLNANTALTGTAKITRHIRVDATRLPKCDGDPATLVFLDPPYGRGLGEKALSSALNAGWIAPEALIVWEESSEIDAPAGMQLVESRRYGETRLNILRMNAL